MVAQYLSGKQMTNGCCVYVCEGLRLDGLWACPVDSCVFTTDVKRTRASHLLRLIIYDSRAEAVPQCHCTAQNAGIAGGISPEEPREPSAGTRKLSPAG